VQLFRELGHATYDIVSKTLYARFHGPAGTPADYGEMPSQMLENWYHQPGPLERMSRHYFYLPEYRDAWQAKNSNDSRPPQHTPDDIITTLSLGGPKHDIPQYLRQIFLYVFDMTIHQPESHEAVVAMNLTGLWNSLQQSICLLDNPAVLGVEKGQPSRGFTIFGHLMNDYDAGYYSYLL
jgi:metallopeptidase MepB